MKNHVIRRGEERFGNGQRWRVNNKRYPDHHFTHSCGRIVAQSPVKPNSGVVKKCRSNTRI
jgi:hypothetical protein